MTEMSSSHLATDARKNLETQLEIIANGSQKETVVARRELEKILSNTHRINGARRSIFTKGFCEALIARLRTIPDATHHAKYLSTIAHMVLYFGNHSRDLLFDLMFEKILDSDARVRGKAVMLADVLRLELFTDHDPEGDLRRVEILLRIKKLIREYAPRQWFSRDEMDPVYVQSLPASVVKSLLSLWDACANVGMYSEEFIEQHPECLPGIPLRWWNDPFESEEPPEFHQKVEDAHESASVPPEVHAEYISYHANSGEPYAKEEVIEARTALLRKKTSVAEKKEVLFRMAHTRMLRALNAIRAYLKNPDKELTPWAAICWQEAQAGILSEGMKNLFGEEAPETDIVMGGLGGDHGRLRYCFALSTAGATLNKKQRAAIASALSDADTSFNCSAERTEFSKNWARVTALIPWDVAPAEYIEDIIISSNARQPFLRFHYFVVNTYMLSDEEIENYIIEVEREEKGGLHRSIPPQL